MHSTWELWFDNVLFGIVRDVVYVDDTYTGIVTVLNSAENDALRQKLRRFMEECVEWNRQLKDGSQEQVDASVAFRAFESIITGRHWRARRGSQEVLIDEAPVFFPGDEVSWRPLQRS